VQQQQQQQKQQQDNDSTNNNNPLKLSLISIAHCHVIRTTYQRHLIIIRNAMTKATDKNIKIA
jgi:hypothetical protein